MTQMRFAFVAASKDRADPSNATTTNSEKAETANEWHFRLFRSLLFFFSIFYRALTRIASPNRSAIERKTPDAGEEIPKSAPRLIKRTNAAPSGFDDADVKNEPGVT